METFTKPEWLKSEPVFGLVLTSSELAWLSGALKEFRQNHTAQSIHRKIEPMRARPSEDVTRIVEQLDRIEGCVQDLARAVEERRSLADEGERLRVELRDRTKGMVG